MGIEENQQRKDGAAELTDLGQGIRIVEYDYLDK